MLSDFVRPLDYQAGVSHLKMTRVSHDHSSCVSEPSPNMRGLMTPPAGSSVQYYENPLFGADMQSHPGKAPISVEGSTSFDLTIRSAQREW